MIEKLKPDGCPKECITFGIREEAQRISASGVTRTQSRKGVYMSFLLC
jgi:hypothetical protein